MPSRGGQHQSLLQFLALGLSQRIKREGDSHFVEGANFISARYDSPLLPVPPAR